MPSRMNGGEAVDTGAANHLYRVALGVGLDRPETERRSVCAFGHNFHTARRAGMSTLEDDF